MLLGIVGGVDSLCYDASVEAIYLDLIAGKDILRIVHMILV